MTLSNGAGDTARALPAPLRVTSDMASTWTEGDFAFDVAADHIIAAHKKDGAARDLPVTDLKTWVIAPDNGRFALVPLARHHTAKPLRSNAFGNLMTRLGAPGDFMKRLPAPLQLATVNYLITESPETMPATLRLRGHEVSALVSGRYAPLDPEELLQNIRDALVRFDLLHEVRVRGVASGLVDNLRLVLPSDQVAVKPGDVSAVGLDITTSSFGRSAIHVSPVVYRLVCSNGLKSPERKAGFSFRHVGDTQRLREGVAEAIPAAMVHARGIVDQWRRSVTFMVEDVQRQIEALRELTVLERKALEIQVQGEANVAALPERLPLYDFLNAITSSAKKATPARRLEIESVAGEVLRQRVGAAR